MESVRPPTPFHDTPSLLIDYLHLVVVDDIVNIFLKQRVCLKQLIDSVYTLGLDAVVRHDVVLALLFLFRCQRGVVFHLCHLATHIGQHEELRIFRRPRQGIDTLIRQFDRLVLLVDNEIEFIGGNMHILLILLQVEFLRLLQTHFDTRL